MVINVRGTSGSGKTSVMRGIMTKAESITKIGDNPKKPDGYRLTFWEKNPTYLVGSYENVCGGCDGIQTQDEITARVLAFASPDSNVLFEGLLMSHTYQRYADVDNELKKQGVHCIWAWLDTPLALCLERVSGRREAKRLLKADPGEAKPLNPKNTTDGHRTGITCMKKFKANSYDVRDIDHTNGVEQVFSWLE